MAASCEELTHWKRLWCWEGLGAGGEGDDRGWDGWMGSPTRWTWVWVNSRSWWWPGRPGVLRFMGSQRVRHDWATDLIWTESSCQEENFEMEAELYWTEEVLFINKWLSHRTLHYGLYALYQIIMHHIKSITLWVEIKALCHFHML